MAVYIPHSIFYLARLLYVGPETFRPTLVCVCYVYICVYMYIYIYIYTHTHACVCTYIHINMYIWNRVFN